MRTLKGKQTDLDDDPAAKMPQRAPGLVPPEILVGEQQTVNWRIYWP